MLKFLWNGFAHDVDFAITSLWYFFRCNAKARTGCVFLWSVQILQASDNQKSHWTSIHDCAKKGIMPFEYIWYFRFVNWLIERRVFTLVTECALTLIIGSLLIWQVFESDVFLFCSQSLIKRTFTLWQPGTGLPWQQTSGSVV